MKTTRSFRPAVQPLEGRVVLSFSLSKMMHSVFPFIPDKTRPKVIHSASSVYQQIPGTHATTTHAHPKAAPHAALARHLATVGPNGRTG